jgi:endonuclease III
MLFDLGAGNKLADIRDRLRHRLHLPPLAPAREPIAALIKSMISCRTYDEVSQNAFDKLIHAYPDWATMAVAPPSAIKAVIAEVTLAEPVSVYIGQALRRIALTHADFDLGFLKAESVPKALAWLERLTGVGRKVSAASLNFSTLHMPALVIDTHVLRVMQRLWLVSPKADTRMAYDHIMAELYDWSAGELSELHCLMKALGQTHCHAAWPQCRSCPLNEVCESARQA